MKRLLVFGAYYEPETAASLYLFTNLCEDFAKRGWRVDVYVPTPTRGVDAEVRRRYKRKKTETKIGNRLVIHRVALMREGAGIVGRALRYLLMNMVFIWKGIRSKGDAVFVDSTPPTQGAMAAIIARIRRVPFIYSLQDVFPDSMVNAGMISEDSCIYRIGRRIENFTYKNAAKIIVISEDIKKNIMEKGVDERKIVVVSNWVEADMVRPVPREENPLFEKFGINKSVFNVVYAGNLGYVQNIELIIEAAERLKEENICFTIFGKGAQEQEYKTKAQKMRLSNIVFLPLQPYTEVSKVYSMGDVCIVPCKAGFGGSAMPSKTWNIMATGTPIIASFDADTDMQRLIEKKQVGKFCEAGNIEQLVQAIKFYKEHPEERAEAGLRARKYIETHLSRETCTGKYADIIEKEIERNAKNRR